MVRTYRFVEFSASPWTGPWFRVGAVLDDKDRVTFIQAARLPGMYLVKGTDAVLAMGLLMLGELTLTRSAFLPTELQPHFRLGPIGCAPGSGARAEKRVRAALAMEES